MNKSNFFPAPTPKRKRLSYACNYCRSKKTRCDEQFPSCRNCQLAGVPCITVNKRRPNALVQNRRKYRPSPSTERSLDTEPQRVTALVSPETSGISPSSVGGLESSTAPAQSRLPSPGSIPEDVHEWSTPSWDTKHLPVMPTRVGSSILQMSMQWLDLAFSRLQIPYTSPARVSLRPCLSGPSTFYEYPIRNVEPSLPPLDELHRLVELYFKVYHPVYPFLDRHFIFSLLDEVSDRNQQTKRVHGNGRAARSMLLYLIITLGSLASPQISHSSLNSYLAFCHTLVGHVILQPVLDSVQALLLFSITLRLRDQLSQAWDVLTLAISMSQTLRFAEISDHRQFSDRSLLNTETCISRTWWNLYVFEKFLAFDSGRKSSLQDSKLASFGKIDSKNLSENQQTPKQSYKYSIVYLANVLHEMQHRSWHTWKKESLETTSEGEARANKIRAAGEIDTLLCDWRGNLPPQYQ